MEWCTQPRLLPSCGLWFMHGSDPSLWEQSHSKKPGKGWVLREDHHDRCDY
jgi:hypothetical protein